MQKDEDNLAKFHALARANQLANQTNFADWYAIIKAVDDCFARGGKHLTNAKPVIAALLFLRCQYAFKTAAGLALAGQAVETFVMLRSVLEYAGYALLIHDKPQLQEVWLKRHIDEDGKREQKSAFRISEVKAAVEQHDARVREIFDEQYERSIDFGGHPNPHAMFGAMSMTEQGEQTEIMALAISNDQTVLAHALKSTAQFGFTALHIFQHIYKEKFELLGIREVMDGLRNTGRL